MSCLHSQLPHYDLLSRPSKLTSYHLLPQNPQRPEVPRSILTMRLFSSQRICMCLIHLLVELSFPCTISSGDYSPSTFTPQDLGVMQVSLFFLTVASGLYSIFLLKHLNYLKSMLLNPAILTYFFLQTKTTFLSIPPNLNSLTFNISLNISFSNTIIISLISFLQFYGGKIGK